MPLLARAAGLEVLGVAVNSVAPDGQSHSREVAAAAGAAATAAVAGAGAGSRSVREDKAALVATLSAAVRLPRLRELCVGTNDDRPANLASLAEFVHTAPCSLTSLVVASPKLDVPQVATITASRTLQRLAYDGCRLGEWHQHWYEQLVSHHRARGLRVLHNQTGSSLPGPFGSDWYSFGDSE